MLNDLNHTFYTGLDINTGRNALDWRELFRLTRILKNVIDRYPARVYIDKNNIPRWGICAEEIYV